MRRETLLGLSLLAASAFVGLNVLTWGGGGVWLADDVGYEKVIGGLHRATSMAFLPLPDSDRVRMLIGEKGGRIRVAERGKGEQWTLLPEPFLQMQDVNADLDRGLLSIAIDPAFPRRPFVYTLYTFEPPGLSERSMGRGARVVRVDRYTADATMMYRVAVPGSRRVVLGGNSTLANSGDVTSTDNADLPACEGRASGGYVEDCIPADSDSHSGGMLLFGKDGALYVAIGDGTPANGSPVALRAQELGSLSGKILRVDPQSGEGLPTNPFFDGDPRTNQSRVFALGLRNPFRMAEDPRTGSIYVGDVGWNTWEEINVGPPGSNFGWPCYEGGGRVSMPQPNYAWRSECRDLYARGESAVVAPVYSYRHAALRGAVVLGVFHEEGGENHSSHVTLLFSDFMRSWIRAVEVATGDMVPRDVASLGVVPNDYDNAIVQFVEGPDRDLYTVNLSSIWRMVFRHGTSRSSDVTSSRVLP